MDNAARGASARRAPVQRWPANWARAWLHSCAQSTNPCQSLNDPGLYGTATCHLLSPTARQQDVLPCPPRCFRLGAFWECQPGVQWLVLFAARCWPNAAGRVCRCSDTYRDVLSHISVTLLYRISTTVARVATVRSRISRPTIDGVDLHRRSLVLLSTRGALARPSAKLGPL
jgi:hypothetical protein